MNPTAPPRGYLVHTDPVYLCESYERPANSGDGQTLNGAASQCLGPYLIYSTTNTLKKKKSGAVAIKNGRTRKVLVLPTPAVKKAVKREVKREEKTFATRLANNFSKPGLGKGIGDLIVPGVGGAIGHAAESLFRTIFGQGDYVYSDIVKPSAMPLNNTILGVQSPAVAQMVDEMHWSGLATRIAHREFIGRVDMSAGFSVRRFVISPTDPIVFPWLNSIANLFMKYKVLGAAIEYVPTSANAVSGGNPAMGSVSLAVQYDEYAPSPTLLQQMLNWQGSVTGRPTDNLVCGVECDGGYTPVNPLYIRHPTDPTGPDNRLTDFGQFILATDGPGTGYTGAGQLWITYDLLLIGAYVPPFLPPLSAELQPRIERQEDDAKNTSCACDPICSCAKKL